MDDGDALRHQEGDDKGRGGARQDLVALDPGRYVAAMFGPDE